MLFLLCMALTLASSLNAGLFFSNNAPDFRNNRKSIDFNVPITSQILEDIEPLKNSPSFKNDSTICLFAARYLRDKIFYNQKLSDAQYCAILQSLLGQNPLTKKKYIEGIKPYVATIGSMSKPSEIAQYALRLIRAYLILGDTKKLESTLFDVSEAAYSKRKKVVNGGKMYNNYQDYYSVPLCYGNDVYYRAIDTRYNIIRKSYSYILHIHFLNVPSASPSFKDIVIKPHRLAPTYY